MKTLNWSWMTIRGSSRRLIALLFACGLIAIAETPARAITFSDPGFTKETVATLTGLQPVEVAFAPDGRLFVASKLGTIRIIKGGVLLSTPFIDISGHVNLVDDRGLLGIALDPNFATNGFVYLLYVYEGGGNANDPGAKTSRLTRVTANPANPDVALPTETILLGSVSTPPCSNFPITTDCIADDHTSHAIGTLRFAPDGNLFVGSGDGADFNAVDSLALRAQNLSSLNGKILRVKPDGTAPGDNPFDDGTNSNQSKVWAYGLRNPFRYNLNPATGLPYIGDVGWNTWEEVNKGIRGANYGWPCYEGAGPEPDYQAQFTQCQQLAASAVTPPIYTYDHSLGSAAVVGGAFYNGTQYPAAYQGNFFFADYARGWIQRITFNAQGNLSAVIPFSTSTSNPVNIEMGPDGMLYYVDIGTEEVARIRFTGGTFTLSGTISPSAAGSGATVTLSGTATGTTSADANGNYSFGNLGNGTYSVAASKGGFAFTPATQSVTINGASVTGVNFTAAAGSFSISGSISPAATGSGATVTLGGAAGGTTTADSGGNYTFGNLGSGSYTVTPSKAGVTFTPPNQTVLLSGASVTGINFTASTGNTFSISGVLGPALNGDTAWVTLAGPTSATTTSDPSGNYTFTNLPNGTYTVIPSLDGMNWTPTSQTVTVNGANVSGINFAGTPAAGVSLDVTAFGDQGFPQASVTTAVFSTSTTNELLLAFVSADSGSSPNTTVTRVTGGGLTWTLVQRTNAQLGTAEIWRAFAPNPLTNISVTASLSQSVNSSMTVVVFSGVDATNNGANAIGNTGTANAISGAPSGSLTTTRANSWVLAVGNDWDKASSRTLGANQTLLHQYLAPVGDTYWVQMANAPTPAAGTVVALNDTAPTTDRYNLSLVEVRAAVTTFSISGTVSPSATGSGVTLTLSGSASATTTADTSGSYAFNGLANGSYTVTPSKAGLSFSPASQPVTVSGANVTGVNFTAAVVPTFSVSGTISPAASGSGATVTLSGAANGSTTADVNGNYTFSNLVNGGYTITPSKTGFTFAPSNQPVTVNGADVTGVNFTATVIPTFSISGTLSPSASGSGATLTLSGAAGATATADANGNYAFNNLLNGGYTVTPSKTGFTFSPSSQPVTVNGANVTGVNFTVTAAVGLAIDATAFGDRGTSATTVATASFSTKAGNELLLAFVAADSVKTPNTTVTRVTGGGLTWTLVQRTNAQLGTAEIWRAFAPNALTSITVTATLSQSVPSSITVVTFTGVDTTNSGASAVGAVASANAASGAPSATLTTTRNNSWIFGVGNDWDKAIARTLGANQTLVHQYLAPVGDTYWVQRMTAPTPTSGTAVTVNDTAPTTDRFNLTLVEVRTP